MTNDESISNHQCPKPFVLRSFGFVSSFVIRVSSFILLLASPVPAQAPPATQPIDAAPIVLVLSRRIGGTTCGNGFAIGDGSLIVTARHVVFPERLTGLHQGDAFVTLFSPYLGDACEADVVAQDRELDLIVLRCRWKGHPAIALADDADIVAAENVTVAGFTDAITALTAAQPGLLKSPPVLAVSRLAIDSVTVRRGVTRTLVTLQAPTGPSWAGAPMLLDDGACAAVYARTQAGGNAGVGTASGPIRKLIEDAHLAPERAADRMTSPADSPQATALFLQSVAASAVPDSAAAEASLNAFLKLRPNSAIAYRDLAGQAHALKRLDDAQNLYAKALELEPALVSARVLYGQLLYEQVLPENALKQLRYAFETGRGSNAAVIPMVNILREQHKDAECVELLKKALARNPRDAFLWNYLGQSQRELREHASAAESFAKSGDLMPENEAVRVQAGEEYEIVAEWGKAEEQYRRLVQQDPKSSGGHFFLARCLARQSRRQAEALQVAQEALRLSDAPGSPPKADIQALIAAIRAGRTVPANDFRL